VSTLNLRYRSFSRDEWAQFRSPHDSARFDAVQIAAIRSLNDRLTNADIEEVYLPLNRYIELHLDATRSLTESTSEFLHVPAKRIPFVLGIAGSVAAGKSTTARVIEELLGRSFKVSLVTTDGFLYPTAELEARGLLERKGFPESYDVKLLVDFLATLKSGAPRVTAPVYSHIKYDRVPDEEIVVEEPEVLILEGINILQGPQAGEARTAERRVVSDFLDLSIFLHAEEDFLRTWYVNRFLTFRKTVFSDPESHFRRYATLSDEEAIATAKQIWENINGKNLHENILPTRNRADVILNKGAGHRVETIEIKRR
jgi:type I pantothenate kinase